MQGDLAGEVTPVWSPVTQIEFNGARGTREDQDESAQLMDALYPKIQ